MPGETSAAVAALIESLPSALADDLRAVSGVSRSAPGPGGRVLKRSNTTDLDESGGAVLLTQVQQELATWITMAQRLAAEVISLDARLVASDGLAKKHASQLDRFRRRVHFLGEAISHASGTGSSADAERSESTLASSWPRASQHMKATGSSDLASSVPRSDLASSVPTSDSDMASSVPTVVLGTKDACAGKTLASAGTDGIAPTKPIDQNSADSQNSAATPEPNSVFGNVAPLVSGSAPFRLVLVDDDPWQRVSISQMCAKAGHEVIAVLGSAEELMSRVESDGDAMIADIFLVDVHLDNAAPVPSGATLAENAPQKADGLMLGGWLRQLPRYDAAAVIGMSASEDGEHVKRALLNDCDSFLPKPLSVPQIRHLGEFVVQRRIMRQTQVKRMVGLSQQVREIESELTEMLDSHGNAGGRGRDGSPEFLARVGVAGDKLSLSSTASAAAPLPDEEDAPLVPQVRARAIRAAADALLAATRRDVPGWTPRHCNDVASAGHTMRRQVSAVSSLADAVASSGIRWAGAGGRDGGKSAVDLGGGAKGAATRNSGESEEEDAEEEDDPLAGTAPRLEVNEAGSATGRAADQRPSLRRGDSGRLREMVLSRAQSSERVPGGREVSPHVSDGGDGRNVEGDGGGLVGSAGRGGPPLVACRLCERRFAAGDEMAQHLASCAARVRLRQAEETSAGVGPLPASR